MSRESGSGTSCKSVVNSRQSKPGISSGGKSGRKSVKSGGKSVKSGGKSVAVVKSSGVGVKPKEGRETTKHMFEFKETREHRDQILEIFERMEELFKCLETHIIGTYQNTPTLDKKIQDINSKLDSNSRDVMQLLKPTNIHVSLDTTSQKAGLGFSIKSSTISSSQKDLYNETDAFEKRAKDVLTRFKEKISPSHRNNVWNGDGSLTFTEIMNTINETHRNLMNGLKEKQKINIKHG